MRLLLTAALLCALLAFAGGASREPTIPMRRCSRPQGRAERADELSIDQAAAQQAMTCLTNYARAQSGLVPLQPNSALNEAGQAKLRRRSPARSSAAPRAGARSRPSSRRIVQGATSYGVGENLAWGTGNFGTPRQTMNGWLHSTRTPREHLESGLSASSESATSPDQTFQSYAGAALWSQEFGTRTPASPAATVPVGAPAEGSPA